MATMPMCLRFCRILDNASYKIPQPSLRKSSFVSCKPQNSKFHNDARHSQEYIRSPVPSTTTPWRGYAPWRAWRCSGGLQDNSTWQFQKQMSTAPEGKNQTDQSQEQSSANTTEGENNPEEKIKNLTLEVEQLTKKVDELTDKYKRALADGENLRQRFVKQVDDARQFGIQGFCKDLLEVADTLSKATECVPKNEVTDNNPHLKNLFEGLTMTEAELQKVFKKHGLVPVNPLDEKFDPNQHEALFQQEVEGKKPGTVVVVSKIGYKLHDRIVRPALVGVAKG